jgi:putative lipoic acid-binding regulatory protein
MPASTDSGGGAAAVLKRTRWGKSRFSSSGAFSSVAITIGAPHRCVTP